MRSIPYALMLLLSVAAPSATAQSASRSTATRLNPLAVTRYQEGLQLMAREAWDDAAAAFNKALALEPQWALAHYWLGRARLSGGQYRMAIAALTASRDRYLDELAHRTSTDMDAQQRYNDRMVELIDAIQSVRTSNTSGSASGQRISGILQDQVRDIDYLRRSANAEVGIQPPAFVSLSLGSAYFRAGDRAAAEEHYRAAIRANPKTGEAHNNLAVVYMQTGRKKEAENEIRLAEKAGFRVNPQLKEDVKKMP